MPPFMEHLYLCRQVPDTVSVMGVCLGGLACLVKSLTQSLTTWVPMIK